ncbi:MAG: GYD domain-containing protein [Vicinamibacterales bacterium]
MPTYLLKVQYNADGVKGLVKDGGTTRVKVVTGLIEGIGGIVKAFYYALGDADAYLIVETKAQSDALALSMAVNGSGAVRISSTLLVDPAEVDAAAKKVPAYRVPGA